MNDQPKSYKDILSRNERRRPCGAPVWPLPLGPSFKEASCAHDR